jgi:mono/diheme cytochrome c family protein
MTKKLATFNAVTGFIFLFMAIQSGFSCGQKSDETSEQDPVATGEYLVNFHGCNDCHSPKLSTPDGLVLDKSRLLSGHPADEELPEIDPSQIGSGKWILSNVHSTARVGPWGVTFAKNLTPDNETGLGLWTEEVFVEALRAEKHRPPMLVFSSEYMTDDEVKSVFVYLKTLKPIKNEVSLSISYEELKQRHRK